MDNSEFRSKLTLMSQTLTSIHMIGGNPACKENQILVSQFYQAWLYLASDVTLQFDVSNYARLQRLNNFCCSLRNDDVLDILNICQDAASLLISEDVTSWTSFKGSLLSQHPGHGESLVRLLSPISPLLQSMFVEPDVKAECLRWCLPFLKYGKRLNLSAIGIEEQAISMYLKTEERLKTIALDGVAELVSGLNRVMRVWLRDLDLTNLIPQHGSGSVAEGKLSLYDKFNSLHVDLYLKIVLGPLWYEYYPRDPGNELVRVSRTIFVPKTFSKLRTISMEPVTLQYFQQGVMKRLYSFIQDHPYLGKRIKLRDQTQNQKLAKQGSIDDSFATIDLSAASDSVSWNLVKGIFARTPLLKWLYATRSKKTMLPTGKIITLEKFAPMGSALCFPIECLIFAVVIEYVSQKWCSANKSAKPNYSVFGDDMVVDTRITNDVVEALESLGFVVNHDKSFVRGKFKESCGRDYYDGSDVTSVYYSFDRYNDRRLSPEVYAALCSAANLCAERGLHELRGFILKLILPYGPYFTDTTTRSPEVYSSQPTNYHVRRKYNEDYQMWIGRFCQVISRPVEQESTNSGHRRKNDDDVAYFVRLAQMATDTRVRSFDEPVIGITLHGSCVKLGRTDREVDVKE